MAASPVVSYLDTKELVALNWGDAVAELFGHPRIRFTEEHVEVTLKSSVPSGAGGDTSVLQLHEPCVGELKQLDEAKGDIARAAILVRVCAGIPGASVDKIKGSDLGVIAKVASAFLSDTPQTGGT